MVTMEQAWLLPAIMAGSFVVLALLHNYLPRQGDFLAVGAMGVSFVLFLLIAVDLFDQMPAGPGELVDNLSGFTWVQIEQIDFEIRIAFLVDQIAIVMLAAVSLVGLMVFIYSLSYMKGDRRYGWYYAVLSLFVASMMTLVLADNLLLLYIVWEGVGVCSFLLIGHYFERRSAAEAAKKAFITTRLGDVGLLIGIILLWREVGSFNLSEIFAYAQAGNFDEAYLTTAVVLLFVGAMGKSAQFPFHVWLPDAMEGPTPVSALIHAATMVVAGVYLVARTMPLFEVAHDGALYLVIVIGMITTFISAFMGLVMTDIKKVVAYSTINSLGLMMVALGVGSPAAAMLYLFAHAFFKALLFLASGSVIHATEQQDISALGGLIRKMPLTGWTFVIGALAMAGLAPLSGFFAKDEILVEASHFSWVVFAFLFVSVPITALYMIRIVILTFFGVPRDHHAFDHAHESPPLMSVPLLILAALAVVAGFVVFDPIGEALGWGYGFMGFVESVIGDPHEFQFDWPIAIASTLAVIASLGLGVLIWRGDAVPAREARTRFPFLYSLFANKFYMDDLYQWNIDRMVLGFAKIIAFFDRAVVNDTGVNGPAEVTGGLSWVLKFQQTGKLPNYALAMILGVTIIAIIGFSVRG
jgi:NADH-quinone oxidoreductase subunit L